MESRSDTARHLTHDSLHMLRRAWSRRWWAWLGSSARTVVELNEVIHALTEVALDLPDARSVDGQLGRGQESVDHVTPGVCPVAPILADLEVLVPQGQRPSAVGLMQSLRLWRHRATFRRALHAVNLLDDALQSEPPSEPPPLGPIAERRDRISIRRQGGVRVHSAG